MAKKKLVNLRHNIRTKSNNELVKFINYQLRSLSKWLRLRFLTSISIKEIWHKLVIVLRR